MSVVYEMYRIMQWISHEQRLNSDQAANPHRKPAANFVCRFGVYFDHHMPSTLMFLQSENTVQHTHTFRAEDISPHPQTLGLLTCICSHH